MSSTSSAMGEPQLEASKSIELDKGRKVLKIKDYSISQGLLKHFKEEKFCDITLIAKKAGVSRRIPTHRVILSSASDYFETLLTIDMQERNKAEIVLEDVEGDILYSLVEFYYSGEIKIDFKKVPDLLAAASMFHLAVLEKHLANFHADILDATNCLGIWALADLYNYRDLKTTAFGVVCDNFMEAIKTEDFKRLNPALLVELLKSDDIKVKMEEDAFNAMANWIEFDLDKRRPFIQDVVEVVRFGHVKGKFLLDRILSWCQKIGDAQLFMNISDRRRTEKNAVNPIYYIPKRPSTEFGRVIAVGGIEDATGNLSIAEYCPSSDTWKSVRSNIKYRQFFDVNHLNNQRIIIIGGFKNKQTVNTVDLFDLKTGNSKELCPMITARSLMSMACSDECIFVVGGFNGNGHLKSVERYDVEEDKWTELASMSVARYRSTTAILSGKIFVVGGVYENNWLNSVECYDPDRNRWKTVRPMNESRNDPRARVADGFIYVTGHVNNEWSSTFEKYDPIADTWTLVAFSQEVPWSVCALLTFEDWAYVVGEKYKKTKSDNSFEKVNLITGECVSLTPCPRDAEWYLKF